MSRGFDIGTRLGLDDINLLRARGFEVAFRYLGPDAAFGGPKGLDGAEVAGYLSRGLGIELIGQKTANIPEYFTYVQGLQDGRDYRDWALTLGAPLGIPIRFPVDTDMSDPATEANPYFNGAYDGLDGAYGLGVYGEYDLVEAVARHYAGVVTTWQTAAWSGGRISELADAYQYGSIEIRPGLTIDLNIVRTEPKWRLVRGIA